MCLHQINRSLGAAIKRRLWAMAREVRAGPCVGRTAKWRELRKVLATSGKPMQGKNLCLFIQQF